MSFFYNPGGQWHLLCYTVCIKISAFQKRPPTISMTSVLMRSILMLPPASSGDDQLLWRLKNIFCLNNIFLRVLAQAISVIRKSACIKLIWMYCLGTEEESACVYDVCAFKWRWGAGSWLAEVVSCDVKSSTHDQTFITVITPWQKKH